MKSHGISDFVFFIHNVYNCQKILEKGDNSISKLSYGKYSQVRNSIWLYAEVSTFATVHRGCSILNLTVIGSIIGCVLGYLMDRLCDMSLKNIKKIHGNDNVQCMEY